MFTRVFTNQRHQGWGKFMKYLFVGSLLMGLQGCTLLAVADAAGSAVIYGAKTTVRVLDAVTPDIITKKKD